MEEIIEGEARKRRKECQMTATSHKLGAQWYLVPREAGMENYHKCLRTPRMLGVGRVRYIQQRKQGSWPRLKGPAVLSSMGMLTHYIQIFHSFDESQNADGQINIKI